MSIQRVIIELSPSRIEVATTRNGVLGEWRRERVARAEWPSPFTTVLPEAADVIGKLLAEMGVVFKAQVHALLRHPCVELGSGVQQRLCGGIAFRHVLGVDLSLIHI